MYKNKVIRTIDKAGVLLVYPIQNQKEPPSIWHSLYPNCKMSWDWADSADDRVVDLWHLRTELSVSRKVVYTKWYQGRATFFSRPVFTALLKVLNAGERQRDLPEPASEIYRLLLDDSPQTPRMMREALGLLGKTNEAAFNRGIGELWRRLLVVGFGELDEGSYPALQVGATKHQFEDLWDEALELDPTEAERTVAAAFREGSAFGRQLKRLKNKAKRRDSAQDRAPPPP